MKRTACVRLFILGALLVVLLVGSAGPLPHPEPSSDGEGGDEHAASPRSIPTSAQGEAAFKRPTVQPLAESPTGAALLRDVTAERGWTAEALAARQAAAGVPVWLEGDELSFTFRGPASAVRLCCGIQMDLHRVAGSDMWALTVKNPELPRAIVSYAFFVDEQPPLGQSMAPWRGPLAPAAPAQAEYGNLQGAVRTERLQSSALGEEREVTVYLAPGYAATQGYPTIYAADGESTSWLARVLEPPLLAGALPPLLLVGAHSGEQRAEEYLPSYGAARFAAHERFFVEELAAWAERELGATIERPQRVVFGFSNGGVFAGEMVLRHPERFGVAFPFSAGIAPDTTLHPPAATVRVYLTAGLFEQGFYTTTRAFAQQLERAGATIMFNPRAAGHDAAMWEEEFVAAALWAFGVEERRR
jgi:enterochelin esterase-like enzyme